MKKTSNYVWGIFFIVFGIILGLNSLNIANINIFFDGWWTLFIIVPCLINIFNEKEKLGNIIGLVIGILLLLSCRGLISFTIIWKLLLPIILILIGLSIIFKNRITNKITEKVYNNSTNEEEYCTTFGEQNISIDKKDFKGCNLSAIFGSLKCNLEKIEIEEDIVINTLSLFGSVTITIPDNANVIVKGVPIFGGINNRKIEKNKSNKTIYINATCLFGGLDIK